MAYAKKGEPMTRPDDLPPFIAQGAFNEEDGAEAHADFPMDEVIARLDGEPLNLSPRDRAELAQAFGRVFDWMLGEPKIAKGRTLYGIGLRTVAAAWVIDPRRFQNASLHDLGIQLGFTAPNISPLTAEFSRLFGVRNRFQAHDWRKKYRR